MNLQQSKSTNYINLNLKNKIRFITATSLFDGHDVTINIIRRILQYFGVEVIHLGHNRSAEEVVNAAIAEDVQGIAVSSYQGGHIEYFTYMINLLAKKNASHIKIFGGGGGVISKDEINILHKKGVCKIFSPDDGLKDGLDGMVMFMINECDKISIDPVMKLSKSFSIDYPLNIARMITTFELFNNKDNKFPIKAYFELKKDLQILSIKNDTPVIGVTGTGGSGKSSLIDEILLRFLSFFPHKTIAVLTIDPSKKKTGGALLGDRIRLNSAISNRVFVRSMATRRTSSSTSKSIMDAILCFKAAAFDLIILETAGIGQNDSEVSNLCDLSVYVMTPEYGALSQLEKIDMLDFADFVVINKFDKTGGLDAIKDVRKTYQRNHKLFDKKLNEMPVYSTLANNFNDFGVNKFFVALFNKISSISLDKNNWIFNDVANENSIIKNNNFILDAKYLRNISKTIRNYHENSNKQILIANSSFNLMKAFSEFENDENSDQVKFKIKEKYNKFYNLLDDKNKNFLLNFDQIKDEFKKDEYEYAVRDRKYNVSNFTSSLSGLKIPKIALPDLNSWGDKIKFLAYENFPGNFPFTSGIFKFKRQDENTTRMFAGEGTPERTNKRFHFFSSEKSPIRLSTAFDSPTLYGANPDNRPDIYGKIGNSGVSVCCLDDIKRLYSGFDLCLPSSSVSMTINGPAPIMLAYFFNGAIDAECEKYLKKNFEWLETELKIKKWFKCKNVDQPSYREILPSKKHNKMGLGFLGVSASWFMEKNIYENIKKNVLHTIRGTVQADILKEDQAQNTCIFSSSFALRMMGDVQEYFVQNDVKNFYSASISGYHIAEAGANPITQLAFTLANGFTMIEYYLSRGMNIDKFAQNLSFFFSNGLDAEYSVIGRVARRIWAISMRNYYKANERSQKLKYHIQTSGRSLHAKEMAFNDIRTTLQALCAISDNCNSLHTNAYDEAITTPTEESVRRAIAIQLIINKELGYIKNENFLQGSYFIEYMTNAVEDSVLKEFESIDDRGGVLGAMETMYQRSKIQEESHFYEKEKHNKRLPIVGVNTFINDNGEANEGTRKVVRSEKYEKDMQVKQVNDLAIMFNSERVLALDKLKRVVISGENIFSELMFTCQVCSIGEISDILYNVGGSYRRNM